MTTLWQDVRYGFRMLRKRPGFTAVALITLAIGIGANTIMFSIADFLLLLRPRKVKAPEQLAYCALRDAKFSWFRYSEYLTLRESGLAFSDVMAQTSSMNGNTLVRDGSARNVAVAAVSANYFTVLGGAPVQGRGFVPEEERPGGAPVIVLSHHLWRRLGSDPKLVGEFLCLSGVDCRVVGVAPQGFTSPLHSPDLWLARGGFRAVSTFYRSRPDKSPWFHLVGRLRPDATMPVAQAQLQTLFPQLKPECIERWGGRLAIDLRPPGRMDLSGDGEQGRRFNAIISLVLMTASAIVLVIACLNLANMLIVQGASRHREIAVRMAIGGGRWRIIRQLLIESGLLAVLGGGLGVVLAVCGMRILNLWIAVVAESLQVGLNVRILAATLGFCLIATLLFGLRPALLLSKRDIAGEMKASGGRVLGGLRRRQGGFSVAGQIALAVALVLSATLLTRSALQKARPDPRFCLADKLLVQIDPLSGGCDEAQSVQACQALADHLASLPQVKALGTSHGVFFGGGGFLGIGEYRPGAEDSVSGRILAREAAFLSTGRDYFEAMEIPLLQGRLFDWRDRVSDAEQVAVIDESLAYKLRPDGNALGCFIQYGVFTKADSDPYRVVGIVAHLPGIEGREVRAQVYTPIEADSWARCLCLHVASTPSAKPAQQQIIEEIYRFDPRMPVLSVATLAQKRYDDESVWRARFGARLSLAAGAAALFLAALGIYAIKGYMVAARTSEIGIRMALGATQGSIIGMVLREGLLLTMAALAVGLALGLAVAKVAARFLYGVSPIDPVSIVVTLALLGAASLLASYLPARRAAKIDPMTALRCE